MKYPELLGEFTRMYRANATFESYRSIGIEMELPVVTQKGEAISPLLIQHMFVFLERKGFQLKRDNVTHHITSAHRVNTESKKSFGYFLDAIMTDVGSAVLEIVLAPQFDLHQLQQVFLATVALLVDFFDTHNCKVLGYGLHPISLPSRHLLMPKERYHLYERLSSHNRVVHSCNGNDIHLLTVMASNQCHISVSRKEAITAVNVLNALSGPQIILHANSSIGLTGTDSEHKAKREFFWEFCFPDRHEQMGMPEKFVSWENYLDTLLSFKPMLIKRHRWLEVVNKSTFEDFLFDKKPALARTLEGEISLVRPELSDIHHHAAFCYHNARLAPKYGTVESRMCCQQPPDAPLAPTAVTLGLLSNMEKAQQFTATLSWESWKKLRTAATRSAFASKIEGYDIPSLLTQFLAIAHEGLRKRGRGEEFFLQPLYKRLYQRAAPADEAISIFETMGIDAFLDRYSFTKETCPKAEHTQPYSQV